MHNMTKIVKRNLKLGMLYTAMYCVMGTIIWMIYSWFGVPIPVEAVLAAILFINGAMMSWVFHLDILEVVSISKKSVSMAAGMSSIIIALVFATLILLIKTIISQTGEISFMFDFLYPTSTFLENSILIFSLFILASNIGRLFGFIAFQMGATKLLFISWIPLIIVALIVLIEEYTALDMFETVRNVDLVNTSPYIAVVLFLVGAFILDTINDRLVRKRDLKVQKKAFESI